MAEFGEFLLAQKAQELQGSDDIRSPGPQQLLQAFKAMVRLSTGQGVRLIRATDAVPFAAGVRLSLHANTRVVQRLAEAYMQASRPRQAPLRRALPSGDPVHVAPCDPATPNPARPRPTFP